MGRGQPHEGCLKRNAGSRIEGGKDKLKHRREREENRKRREKLTKKDRKRGKERECFKDYEGEL